MIINASGTTDARPVSGLGLLRAPRVILFGNGQRHALGQCASALGRRALLCTDRRFSESEPMDELCSSLESAGVDAVIFAETEPEPSVDNVLACLHTAGGAGAEVVIGVGGGSCLDVAKAVAILLAHGGSPRDYYGEFTVPGPTLPVIAVPTTAGTGSEATPVAVITDPERTMKVGISSPHIIPHTAICDPELTHSCPPGLTAATGADALAHLIESFTAIRRPHSTLGGSERVFIGKSIFTDAVALEGIKLIGRSLVAAYGDSDDDHARRDVMLAALAGGLALGTAGTAAAHALQYPLGAITHTSHGIGVAVLLPYVMRFNLRERVPEFAAIAAALGCSSIDRSQVSMAAAGVEAVEEIFAAIGIPATLADLGLPAERLPEIAEGGLQARRLVDNNPRPLDRDALLAIARAAHAGDRTLGG